MKIKGIMVKGVWGNIGTVELNLARIRCRT